MRFTTGDAENAAHGVKEGKRAVLLKREKLYIIMLAIEIDSPAKGLGLFLFKQILHG